jgi:hypothetical protein
MADVTFSTGFSRTNEGFDQVSVQLRFEPGRAPAETPQLKVEHRIPVKNRPPKIVEERGFILIGEGLPGGEKDFWELLWEQRIFLGQIAVTVDWTDGSGTARQDKTEFDAGNTLNQPSQVELPSVAPELARSINDPAIKPAAFVTEGTDSASKAVDVLKFVYRQLSTGLGPLWRSIPGLPLKGGRALSELPLAELTTQEELEEAWAQLISEALIGTPYAGPGPNYLGSSDSDVYREAVDPDDPCHPIIFACQHLGTLAAITRGFDDAVTQILDARDASFMLNWRIGAGTAAEMRPGSGDNLRAASASANGSLVPGTNYVSRAKQHIAFVVRVFKSGKMQLIDTGAMQTAPAHTNPLGVTLGSGGLSFGNNYDTTPADRINLDKPISQVAVPPRAQRLRQGIERMKRARPIGLARFVLLKREPDGTRNQRDTLDTRLVAASPLLPMWEPDDPSKNYAISRYFWSLRDHPHLGEFEARWLLDIPQRDAFRATVAARTVEIDSAAAPWNQRLGVADIGSKADGKVRFVGRFGTTIEDGRTVSKWTDGITGNKESLNVLQRIGMRSADFQRVIPRLTPLPIDPGDEQVKYYALDRAK